MAKHVVKIGGSLLFDDNLNVNVAKIQEFVDFIKQNATSIDCVVVGGGKIARLYINAMAGTRPNQAIQDILGIKVAKLNALALASIVGADVAYQGVAGSVEELLRVKSLVPGKVVFLGGFEVGQSTTSVACEVAEALGEGLVVGTDVDGIYTKDPDKHKDAKKLDEIHAGEVARILGLGDAANQQAGEYRILDQVSLGIIGRSKIRVRIVKGDLASLQAALDGEKVGTLVKP